MSEEVNEAATACVGSRAAALLRTALGGLLLASSATAEHPVATLVYVGWAVGFMWWAHLATSLKSPRRSMTASARIGAYLGAVGLLIVAAQVMLEARRDLAVEAYLIFRLSGMATFTIGAALLAWWATARTKQLEQ